MKWITLLIVAGVGFSGLFGQNVNIVGTVYDSLTAEPLSFATLQYANTGAYTNEQGNFQLQLTLGTALTVSYVGYRPQRITITKELLGSPIKVFLRSADQLPGVIVRTPRIVAPGGSIIAPDLQRLAELPALGGEIDVLRSLLTLPGISSGVEGSANLTIRGGAPDQTQYVLDGNRLFNINHLGGFLSSVDPFGMKSMRVYKGGVPARFGGTLSGVVDIDLRKGRRDLWGGTYSFGTATTRLGLEGPVGDKGSLLFTGRYSYPTFLLNNIAFRDYEPRVSGNRTAISLYDFGVKYHRELDQGATLSAAVNFSGDNVLAQEDPQGSELFYNNIRWTNLAATLTYERWLNDRFRLMGRTQVVNYNYRLEKFTSRDATSTDTIPPITELTDNISATQALRFDGSLSWRPSANQSIRLDAGIGRIAVEGGDREAITDAPLRTILETRDNGYEYFVSAEAELSVGSRLSAFPGLRVAGMDRRLFDFSSVGLEPRLRLQYRLNPGLRINTGVERHQQFIHQIEISGLDVPNQLWVITPSSDADTILPASGWQAHLGLSGESGNGRHDWYVELFAKQQTNLLRRQNAVIDNNGSPTDWRRFLATQGEGRIYGGELSYNFATPKTSYAFAYTYTKSEHSYATINNGRYYPYELTREHDFNFSFVRKISDRTNFSFNWTWRSGLPITLPIGRLGNTQLVYGDYNNARLPSYHRADLSWSRSWNKRRNPAIQKTFSFSVFNLYNRRNPFSLELRRVQVSVEDPNTGQMVPRLIVQPVQISLFPIIPSVSYRIKFGGREPSVKSISPFQRAIL